MRKRIDIGVQWDQENSTFGSTVPVGNEARIGTVEQTGPSGWDFPCLH